jgi:hypothetical protein
MAAVQSHQQPSKTATKLRLTGKNADAPRSKRRGAFLRMLGAERAVYDTRQLFVTL